jgi:hypothetical protein
MIELEMEFDTGLRGACCERAITSVASSNDCSAEHLEICLSTAWQGRENVPVQRRHYQRDPFR